MRQAKESLYTAIDIGTTMTRVLVGQVTTSGKLDIVASGTSPSWGIHKGMVRNLDETHESVRTAVEEARITLGRPLPPAWVGVTGNHFQSYNASASMELAYWERAVSREDVEQLIQSAVPRVVPQRRVMHIIPRSYTLDGVSSTRKPVGLYGQRLDVESHIIIADTPPLENVLAAVRKTGVQVRGLVLGSLASAEAVLTADERQMGVLLVDLGGGTSDLALFREGTVWQSSVLPVAGYQFTNDLCLALGLPFPTVEAIKLQHGHAIPEHVATDGMVEFPEPERDGTRQVLRRQICRYINERASELVHLIFYHLRQAGLDRLPVGGIVLTGGTSQLPGLVDLMHELSGAPVRIGAPRGTLDLSPKLCGPTFSTSVGILLWSIHRVQEEPLPIVRFRNPSWLRHLARRVPQFIPARENSAL